MTEATQQQQQQEPAIESRELSSVLCDDLRAGMGQGYGREIQEEGDVCVYIVDPLCCTAEANTTL